MYSLEEKIDILKKSSKRLSEKTFPNCRPGEDLDLVVLKTMDIVVDGYSCGIFYSKSNYESYNIDVLQIWPSYHSFIYFETICKIAKKFLGNKGLYFFNMWSQNKIIYCWTTVLDKDKKIIDNFYGTESKEVVFNDFSYFLINSFEVDLI
jgi:hypothetical protein